MDGSSRSTRGWKAVGLASLVGVAALAIPLGAHATASNVVITDPAGPGGEGTARVRGGLLGTFVSGPVRTIPGFQVETSYGGNLQVFATTGQDTGGVLVLAGPTNSRSGYAPGINGYAASSLTVDNEFDAAISLELVMVRFPTSEGQCPMGSSPAPEVMTRVGVGPGATEHFTYPQALVALARYSNVRTCLEARISGGKTTTGKLSLTFVGQGL